MRKTVYVAGAYSSDTTMGTLINIREAIAYGNVLIKAGLAPYVPHLDFQMVLLDCACTEGMAGMINVDDLQETSIAWLEKADVVFVIPGSDNSKGTKKEIERAKELGIPIYDTLESLLYGTRKEEMLDQAKA